jgi:hypothetical protein
MRIRRFWLLASAMLLIPASARAHGHTADAFGGFSFTSASSLRGFHETYAVSWPLADPNAVKHVSVVGDLDLRVGSHKGNDVTQAAFAGGVRWQAVPSPTAKHIPFAQFLLGGMHTRGNAHNSDSAVRQTDLSYGLGAGYEFDPSPEGWGARVQYDYAHSGGDNFNGFSAGLVYRYKKQH